RRELYRLPVRPRRTPPRTDHHACPANRTPTPEVRDIRHVGVGYALRVLDTLSIYLILSRDEEAELQGQHVRFATMECEFYSLLKKRVDDFFRKNNLSRNSNSSFYLKAGALLFICVTLYAMLLDHVGGTIGLFLIYFLLGPALASLAINVAHDAMHGACHKNASVNRMLGFALDLAGKSSYFWKQTHSKHHAHTNIVYFDEDLATSNIVVRFSPAARRRGFHK